MIDYIQSVIAAVPRHEHQLDDVSEENWSSLRNDVETLFRRTSTEYLICRSAKNRHDDAEHNDALEELRVKAELMWCNVRGKRYQLHDVMALEELLLPHTEVIQALFGISAQTLIDELRKIWTALTFGMGDAVSELHTVHKETLALLEDKIGQEAGPQDQNALMEELYGAHPELQERGQQAAGRFLGFDLFDLQKITNLPPLLLDELSWGPGQETEFFADGPLRGWPQRVWPIFKRPFLKLDGRYYCFDIYSLFDHFYRVMQRTILRLKPSYQPKWNEIQQATSEELPFRLLKRVLPGGQEIRPVWYRWHPRPGFPKDWIELDGLYIFADHLFILEIKAGAFTWTSPATDLPAHIESLRALVQNPTRQGQRFLEYLKNAKSVPVFDRDHNEIGQIQLEDYRKVTVCAITLDPFSDIAAQNQHLRKVGLELGEQPAWSVSIDDLRVFADVLGNPLHFLHFVEQRQLALESDVLQLTDEIDHLGLYLKHNWYSKYASDRAHGKDKVVFHGYGVDIDNYFTQKLHDDKTLSPLFQELPPRLAELIDFLARSDRGDRAQFSSALLDMDGEWRTATFGHIDEALASSVEVGRPKPLSSHGEPGTETTLFLWNPPKLPRNQDLARDHTQALMLMNNEERRLLVELTYDDSGKLCEADLEFLSVKNLSNFRRAKLSELAERIKQSRFAKIRSQRKIGRNEPCPCGSGKKYKRCCLR